MISRTMWLHSTTPSEYSKIRLKLVNVWNWWNASAISSTIIRIQNSAWLQILLNFIPNQITFSRIRRLFDDFNHLNMYLLFPFFAWDMVNIPGVLVVLQYQLVEYKPNLMSYPKNQYFSSNAKHLWTIRIFLFRFEEWRWYTVVRNYDFVDYATMVNTCQSSGLWTRRTGDQSIYRVWYAGWPMQME